MQLFKKMVFMVTFFCFFALALNVPKIFAQNSDLEKIANAAVRHAEKNGGFRDETVSLFYSMLDQYSLAGYVDNVIFYPGTNVDVQKRDKFGFRFTSVFEYLIPFAGKGRGEKEMTATGYSHKFFK